MALCPRRKVIAAIYRFQDPKEPGVLRTDEPRNRSPSTGKSSSSVSVREWRGAASTTGLRLRVETFFRPPFLALPLYF